MKKQLIIILMVLGLIGSALAVEDVMYYKVENMYQNSTLRNNVFNTSFRIYDAESGGTLLFEFNLTEVNYTNGDAFLEINGSKDSITWTQPLWVELYVNTTTYVRKRIGSHPNSFQANDSLLLGGKSESELNVSSADNWDSLDSPEDITLGGNITGTLSNMKVSYLTLDSIIFENLLGFNNLTKCSDTQILKMSGSSWACASDNSASVTDSNISISDMQVTGTTTKKITIEQQTQDGTKLTNVTATFTDLNTGGNSTEEMITAVNNTELNASSFKSIDCSQIVFDTGTGNSQICDGDDAGTSSTYDLNITSDSGSGVITDSEIFTISGGTGISTAISTNTLTITSTIVKWILSSKYLYNDTDTIYFNETYLNATIDARDSDTTYSALSEFDNDLNYFNDISNFTGTLTDTKWCYYTSENSEIYCDQEPVTDTNTNMKGDNIYIYNDTDTHYLNETKLNATIDARATGETNTDSNITVLDIQFTGTTTKTLTLEQQTQDGTKLTNITATFTDIDTQNSTADIQGVAVGGEVSGTVGSITLTDTALDDQYIRRDGDNITSSLNITADNEKFCLGAGNDACLYWNGTALVIE